MKNRILFLDIDGPLIHDRSTYLQRNVIGGRNLPYCNESVAFLKKLYEQFKFQIVVSSSYRLDHLVLGDFLETHHQLKDFEFHPDWKTTSRVVDYPVTNDAEQLSLDHWAKINEVPHTERHSIGQRGGQIQDWVDCHDFEEFDYMVIDDSCDLYPLNPFNVIWLEQAISRGGIASFDQNKIIKRFEEVFVGE